MVNAGRANVGDHQPTARTQHSHRFLDGFFAALVCVDVVNGHAGNNQVKTVVGKGERGHVGSMQIDAIGHAFGKGVAASGLDGIAGLVELSPEVRPHGPAGGQMLGGQEQNRAATASEVQDVFVATKIQLIEQLSPDYEFAPKCGVEVGSENGAHENHWQKPAPLAGLDRKDEVKRDEDRHEDGPGRCVHTVRAATACG